MSLSCKLPRELCVKRGISGMTLSTVPVEGKLTVTRNSNELTRNSKL